MEEATNEAYEQLLRNWNFRREMFNHYSKALGLLMLDDAEDWQQRRTLRAQLVEATQSLREASERLQFYEISMK
ncbi:MAG: hypothetical protein H0X24_11160 [Ktedonobacterales bacterium]|nr:hypothetical protein [Ktedonobacterales bacterium]